MRNLGFWAAACDEPARAVIIDDDGVRHTGGDVVSRVNRQSHALRSLGLSQGDAVAACLTTRVEMLELYMAAMQSGLYFVPIPHGAALPEILHVLGDSQAKVLVFDDRAAGRSTHVAAAFGRGIRCYSVDKIPAEEPWRGCWEAAPSTPPERPVAGDVLFYTSGTTGTPRAVRRPVGTLTLEQVGKRAALHLNAVARIRPGSGACHLVSSPLHHSASLLWCVDHLHLGHAVSLMRKWSPEAMLERVQRDRVTGTLVAPIHFHRLLELPHEVRQRYDLSSLRHVIHTGAPCPVAVKKRMLEWWGPVIYEVYGAAEGAGTRVGPDEWLRRPGTVGRGFGRIRILREDGSLCATHEPGTVFIRLSHERFAYHGDQHKTDSSRRDGYFTAGDIGYVDEDDYLFLCGRSADVIISGGVNIYPAQIESVLSTHPAVRDVAVIGVPDAEWGELVKAFVAVRASNLTPAVLSEELKRHCREHLAGFKCPKTFDFVAELPRGENGKLYKERLRAAEARA